MIEFAMVDLTSVRRQHQCLMFLQDVIRGKCPKMAALEPELPACPIGDRRARVDFRIH
jgi:hypothetical protein